MRIALISLDQAWEDKESNLELCKKFIKQASDQCVELVVFPEMTLTGFSNNIDATAEDFETSQTIQEFQSLAKNHDIAINFGIVARDGEKALNKSIFIDNFGNVLADYSKIHPFSFAGEDRFFNAGDKLTVVEFKDFKIGLTICYDLRFPELYSALAPKCDLIVNIANWPQKRVEHWNTLLKARAIENQIFIAGVNRVGIDGNGLEYSESSMVFNANGDNLSFEKFEDMKIFKIDKDSRIEFKNKFNTTNDRRIDLYKSIL
ncbi:MAG: Omega-amidase YafV [Turneriella sp.]|nr:Omega-amidase YafV [Turneriella sp.]